MADYYTQVAPEHGLPCTDRDAREIEALLLEYAWGKDMPHGFSFTFEPTFEPGSGNLAPEFQPAGSRSMSPEEVVEQVLSGDTLGLGYLIAEEVGSWGELPEAVLQKIGTLIGKAGWEHWEFGAAFTASRLLSGAYGGTAFRIYKDGSIVDRIETWPDKVTVSKAG